MAKMTRNADAKIYREIEDAITFLLLCERGFKVGKMDFFDGAVLAYPSVIKSIADECGGAFFGETSDHWRLASEVSKVRGSVLWGGDEGRTRMVAIGSSELDLVAKHKLAPSLLRMKMTMDDTNTEVGYDKVNPMDRIVEVRAVAVEQSGLTSSLCRNYMIRDRRMQGGVTSGWHSAYPNTWFDMAGGFKANYEAMGFGIGACAASVSRKWWRVLIRFGGQKPGVLIYTDAIGVKDFFRFREIPDGKARRDALVHWVTDHWRQNRVDPEVENYVREHLRGARTFDWHNLSGTIELPEPEIVREQVAIDRRHRLRQAQLDRRLRAIRTGKL